jgi:arylsulfatase A-like enzyme
MPRKSPRTRTIPADLVLEDGRTFAEAFGPRGCDPVLENADGEIEDTGPLTRQRMQTVDDETVAAAIDFIKRTRGGRALVRLVERHADAFPHLCQRRAREMANEIVGRHVDEYAAGMIEHDMHVGQFLDLLDELGIAEETLVFYSTDNGPHMNTWPDASWSPFRGEKNTNWEGAFRVPAMARWPGKIEAGRVSNEIMHHMDWLPTFLAMTGVDDIKEQLVGDGVQRDRA